ncbi:MAG: APC family permease [Pseudomonadota bacterium]
MTPTRQTTTLRRSLGLPAVTLFGLAYMAPIIVYGTFGILAEKSQGTVAMSYLLALIAVLLTVISYGRMANLYPVAGSAYSYARRAIGSHVGFLVGWTVLLDYFFLPMVIWLIGAAYLSAEFPSLPAWLWIVLFIAITTSVNIVGIVFASRTNILLMIVQFLVVAFFIFLCGRYVVAAVGPGGLISAEPFFQADVPMTAALSGAAIAAYSFLGFDAVTTLTEETKDPARTMPRAIITIAFVGGAVFILAAYFAQLVHPGGDLDDAASFEIAMTVGGDLFAAVFLTGLVIAQFTAGLSAQASVGRLLYAMGRDGVLPKRIFGYLHPRFRTPTLNLLFAGLVGFAALFLSEASSTTFINFGAFLAFTAVNLSVAVLFIKWHPRIRPIGALRGLYLPLVGAAITLTLLASLDQDAIVLGSVWLCVGIAYLAILTRLFSRAPPELRIEETG